MTCGYAELSTCDTNIVNGLFGSDEAVAGWLVGRDMMAGMKELVGGEIKSYTEMTDQARTVAEGRMIAEAERLGADAVVAMRFSSGSINPGTIEMLAYGTAVKFV